MQCNNANQYVLMIDNRQKLYRGWRCFHLFHGLDCHCIWTDGSCVPIIIKLAVNHLLVTITIHKIDISFHVCICVLGYISVFFSLKFLSTKELNYCRGFRNSIFSASNPNMPLQAKGRINGKIFTYNPIKSHQYFNITCMSPEHLTMQAAKCAFQ